MRILTLTLFLFYSLQVFGEEYIYSCEYKDRQTELRALSCALFWEARGDSEGYVGRMAVGLVVMNRVYSERFQDNVVDVIYHPFAFSWLNDGKSDRVPNTHHDRIAWKECLQISKDLLSIKHKDYKFYDFTKGSMWYHSNKVSPDWADAKYLTVKINNHLFYDTDVKK